MVVYGRGRRTRKAQGIGSFLKSAYNKGKEIYSKLKEIKPATKALQVLNAPVVGQALSSLPYAGKVEKALKMAQKAGFGKKRRYRKTMRK